MKKLIPILTALLLFISPVLASAQSAFHTWDYNSQRTATSQSNTSADPWASPQASGQVVSYAGEPVIIHIPQLDEAYAPDPVTFVNPKPGTFTFSQYSSTTAITVSLGSVMYQYTWDDAGWGHIWKYNIATGDLVEGNTKTLQISDLIASFPCGGSGFQNGNWITNFADAPSGVTVSDDGNWMAVGAGAKLYWWPYGNPGAMLSAPIMGNTNNNICSASPLITPNGYVMVGDFNGGFVSTTLAGATYNALSTDSAFGSGDPSESITSSPAWNPISNTAWFGIASTSAPRLISFNPSTNSSQVVGKGIITGPVWSPTPVEAANGDTFNTDWGGNAYRWNSAGGLIQKWVTPNGAGHVISNMAIAQDKNGNDHVAWVDMNSAVNNVISPSGSFWVESSLGKAIDPSFVRSVTGDYLGEAYMDQSSGKIFYSQIPVDSASTTPHNYSQLNQIGNGIIGSWLNVVYDVQIGPVLSPFQQASYTWSDDANGTPGIVIYLLSPVQLEMGVMGPSGAAYANESTPVTPIVGKPGDTEDISMYVPGLGLLNPGTYTGNIHVTGFPSGGPQDFIVDQNGTAIDPMNPLGGSVPVFGAATLTLPTSAADYTLTLTETLLADGVATSYLSPTMEISVPVVGVASPGNLTISTFRDGNINNLGTNAGGHSNLVTGNPLKFNYGDTMLANLVIATPPPSGGWQYNSSVLSGTITYPVSTPLPTGTGSPGHTTNSSTKTVSFSVNTRAGSQDNGVSMNDSVVSFPVTWPTWRPPIGVPGYDWDGTLTATWQQSVSYKMLVFFSDGLGGGSWNWVYQSRIFNSTSASQELQRTGTDIYYMMPGSAREPWMR